MGKKRMKRMMGSYTAETWRQDGVLVRRCTNCGMVKTLTTDYHRNGYDADDQPVYRMECKVCYNAKRKENGVSNKHAEFVGHQRHRGESDINFTYQDWLEVVIYFGGCCAYCGRSMRKAETLTRDHLIPWSEGGRTEPGNVIPACPSCNSSKGKQDIKDWYMKQPFFSQERLNMIFQWRAIIKAAGGSTHSE